MITEDNKFSFSDVVLKSKNGKFYMRDNKCTFYEIDEESFRSLLVLTANRHKEFSKSEVTQISRQSLLDFLLGQLELTEELFAANLYDYQDWTI